MVNEGMAARAVKAFAAIAGLLEVRVVNQSSSLRNMLRLSLKMQ
jgi:hypothetical protein